MTRHVLLLEVFACLYSPSLCSALHHSLLFIEAVSSVEGRISAQVDSAAELKINQQRGIPYGEL
jgi:hypothetical protein